MRCLNGWVLRLSPPRLPFSTSELTAITWCEIGFLVWKYKVTLVFVIASGAHLVFFWVSPLILLCCTEAPLQGVFSPRTKSYRQDLQNQGRPHCLQQFILCLQDSWILTFFVLFILFLTPYSSCVPRNSLVCHPQTHHQAQNPTQSLEVDVTSNALP